MNSIYIGSDHAGFETKQKIVEWLKNNNYTVNDLGTNSLDSVDYPDYAFKVCNEVIKNKHSLGVLICGTGFGMCIAANKVKGIRAVDVIKSDMASLAKQHNNANVLCLSGRFISIDENIKIVSNFLNTTFEDRHQKRLDKITNYENQ